MFNSLISLSHLCLVQVISHLSFIFLLKYNFQVEKLIKNSLIWGEQTSKCWVIRNSVACLSSTHLCVCVCLYVFVFFVPYSKKPVMVLNKIVILEDFLHPVLVLSFFCPPPPPFYEAFLFTLDIWILILVVFSFMIYYLHTIVCICFCNCSYVNCYLHFNVFTVGKKWKTFCHWNQF